MISRGVTAIVLTALSALLITSAAASPTPEASRRPILVLLSESPFAIRGSGFRPAERVSVRLYVADRTYAKRLLATPNGAFTARFAAVAVDECKPLSVVATGAAGSRAALARKIQIPPACGIAEQP